MVNYQNNKFIPLQIFQELELFVEKKYYDALAWLAHSIFLKMNIPLHSHEIGVTIARPCSPSICESCYLQI